MADMILTKPAAGAQDIVNAQPDARLLLDFPAGDATLERSGDDLIFRFADGSSLVLRDFYTSYTRENMPDFVIDGTPVSGEEFFTALNDEDLMPAAGPTASNADGGRFREYTDDPLQVGVDRLGGLDLGSGRAFYPEREPLGGLDDGATPLPNRAPIINLAGGVGVAEAGVHPGGNDPYEGVPLVTGRVVATDDDGDVLAYGFINASGQRVTTIATEHGSITIAQDGTFTYTLDNADPDTNGLALGETATETFTVFVDDGRGGFITQPITVTITGTNDRPELSITGSGQGVAEEGAQSVTGTFAVADPDSDAGRNQTFHIDSANGGTGTDGTRGENGSSDASFTTDYGTLTLNPETGKWEYQIDNTSDAVQKLGAGESKTETFNVTVTDEHGATSQQTITVTVTGTNDVPVISGTDDLTLKETGVQDGGNTPTAEGDTVTATGNEHKLIATGKIDASDIDSDDDASTLDYKLQDADGNPADSIETGYGTVSIKPDGTYTYELKDGTANHLAQGESVTETITVMVTDSHGETVTKDVTVTIYGTNDQPTLSLSDTTLEVVESGVGRDGDGNVVDNGTPEQENTEYKGQISAGGTAAGADKDDHASLTFGLKGADGNPHYADNGPVTSGGKYGDLTINQDGSYTYVLRDDEVEINRLNEGEKQSETFTVYVRDEHGAWTAQEITVNITGTNDRPELEIKGSGQSIAEDGPASTVGGDFAIRDLDADGINQTITIEGDKDTPGTPTEGTRGENGSSDATFSTDYGTLTLNPATGKWEYTLDNTSDAVQKLGAGESKTETFNVTVTDEHGATSQQTITVTVTGTNDAPVVDGYSDSLTLTEEGVGPEGGDPNDTVAGIPTVTGAVQAHDIDANDPNLSYSLTAGDNTTITSSDTDPNTGVQTIVTQYGTLVLTPGADGASYTYTLDQGRADTLNAGQEHKEHFTLTVSDGHGGKTEVPILVTIEGTNDQPELTIDNAVQGVKEDSGTYTVSGTFTVTDADADGEFGKQTDGTANQRYSIAGGTAESGDVTTGTATNSSDAGGPATFTNEYGTLTVNPDGTWTYELNNNSKEVQALKEGETRTETFNVTVTDVHGANHMQPITVTITGTNEVPTLEPVTEHVKDMGVFGVVGDKDKGPNYATGDYSGPGGDGHVNDGEQRLEAGGWLQGSDVEGDPLTYGVKTDGLTPDSTLTLTNPDDPTETTTIKVLGVTSTGARTIIHTDAGTFTVTADGSYNFILNTDAGGFVDSIAQGEKWNLTFNMTASDGKDTGEAKLTICIEGTNEIPTLTLDKPTLEVVESGVGRDAEGNVVDNTDNNPETDGNENAPYKGQLSADGKATGDDADNGASLTYGLGDEKGQPQYTENGNTTVTSGGNYGTLTLDKDGNYSYKLDDSKANALHEGETATDKFTIYVKDEHGAYTSQEVTVNITGTNDAPVLSVTGSGQGVVEDKDGAQSVTGTFAVDDPDNDAGKDQTFTIQGGTGTSAKPGVAPTEGSHGENGSTNATFTTEYGTLTLNPATGKWEYALDNTSDAVQSLAKDETKTETFTVTVTDEHGATSTETISVTITGTNDAPDIAWSKVHVREEGVAPGGNTGTVPDGKDNGFVSPDKHREVVEGTLSASDPDSDAKLTFGIDVASKNGGINEDGITVQRYTGSGPVLDSNGNPVTETLTITSNTTSVDPATGHNIQTISTNYGTLTLDTATGHYTFELSTDAANHLPQGEKFDFHFTTTVTDQYGAQDKHMLGVTVEGANDSPELSLSDKVLEVTEAGQTINDADKQVNIGKAKDEGTATGDDADDGAHLTYAFIDADGNAVNQIKTDYGTLHIDSTTGKYWFQLDNNAKVTQELKAGDVKELNGFTVRVTDEHGAYAEDKIDVKINGSNDAPTMGGDALTVTESGVKAGGNQEYSPSSESDHHFLKNKVSDPDGDKDFTFAITNPGASEVDADGIQHLDTDYGTYFLNTQTGEYWFVLDNDSEKVNQLNAGETVDAYKDGQLKLWVSVTSVRDELSSENWYQVQIKGTNDRPDLTLVSGNSGTPDGWSIIADQEGNATIEMKEGETVKGKVDVDDPDEDGKQGETFTFAVDKGDKGNNILDNSDLKAAEGNKGTVDGDYGTLTINADGTYTYTAHDDLAEGHKYTEDFTIFVKDKLGAWDAQTVTVTVEGSADAPVIKGALPDAHVAEYTEAGVVFKKNEDKDDSIDGPGTSEAADGSFILGTFVAQQTDSQADASGGKGELIAGFVVGGKFYAGELQTGYGTLKITIDGDGTATYSFIPPKEGTPEADKLNSLTDTEEDRIKLFGELGGLKVGVYDSAHAGLVQKDSGHDAGGNYFTIDNGTLIPTQDVDFYIRGSNDRPYFTDSEGNKLGDITVGTGTLVEGGNNVLTGHLAADDPDKNHNPGDLRYSIVLDLDGDGKADKLVQTVEGKYGTLELQKDGSYTYTITKPEELEALNFGQSLTESALEQETFNIRVTDPDNAFTDGKLTIDVTGTKNEPAITADKLDISEDNGVVIDHAADDPAIEGTLTLTDIVDAEDKGNVTWSSGGQVSYADGSGDQPLGTLTVNADGTYTYTLTKNGSDLVQAMNEGDTKTETFKVQAVIEGGKKVPHEITITIHGTNDKPVIDTMLARFEGEVTRNVFDDSDPTNVGQNVTGVIFKGELKGGATDVDNLNEQLKYMLVGEDGQPVSELKTDYGTITLTHIVNKDGSISTSYTYTLDNESQTLIDALKKDPELSDEVKIVAVDPLGAVSDEKGTIYIKINPGDAGGGPGAGIELDDWRSDLEATVKEDGTKPNPNDPTTNEAPSVTGHLEARWADGHTGDAPDHVFGIKGDDGQQVQGHVAVDGKYGHLVINPATGEYTYTLYNGENGKSNPVQDLAEGEVVEESFEIMLNGVSTNEHLTITIKGTNDAPTINTTERELHGEVTEDAYTGWAGKSFSGTVKGTDIDHRLSDELDPVTGKPVFDQDQSEQVYYRFDPDVLPSGYNEQGMPIYTLTLPEGTVTLDSFTGQYTFMADPDHLEHLVAGKSEKVDFQIVATDGKANSEPATITIDLQGVNHAPRLTFSDLNIEDTEDAGQPIVTDLKRIINEDKGFDNLTFSVDGKTVAQGEYGTLVVNKDGTCTYTLNNADDKVQGLDKNHMGIESFFITVTDSDGGTAKIRVNVTVNGENDAPQVTVGEVIKAVEGSEEAYTGKVTAYDKDTVDQAEGALKYAFDAKAVAEHNETASDAEKWTLNADGSLTTQYGTYTIDQNGNYTFTLDNEADAVRKLAAGTLTEQKVTVAVTDHDSPPVTQEVTVNISGQNTAPDFTDAEGKRLTGDNVTLEANKADSPLVEKEGAEVTGKFRFTDPDDKGTVDGISVNGTAISAEGTVITGKYGTLTINPDGSYTYKYTSDALGEGATASETFTVTATDNYGASSTAKLVVNLEGTNDAPVIKTASAPTDGVNGSFSFSDADVSDTHSLSVLIGGKAYEVNAEGKCTVDGVGTFAFTANGGPKDWSYTFTPDKAWTDMHRPDESHTVDFQIQVSDGHVSVPSGDLSVTYQGTNEAPEINATAAGAEGTLAVTDGDLLLLAVVDKDGKEIARLGGDETQDVTIDGHTVTFTRQADGSYKYELDGGSAHVGEKAEVSFSIQATDHVGPVTTDTPITLVAEGTQNDAPTASGGTQGMSLPSMLVPSSLHPGGDVPSVNGRLADSDPDGDSLTYAAGSLTGTYGGLVLNDDGSYTYTLDMSGENLVELVMQRGGTLTETFTYTVSDGHGGSSEGQITVNLDVPDDFSTMSFRRAAPFGRMAGNEDAAHASGGENPQETDSLDTHNTDGGKALHTDGPAQTGTGDAAHDDASSHAQSALSGGENADHLLGASPFTEDNFGDEDIFGTAAQEVFSSTPHAEGFYADMGGLTEAGQLLETPDNSLDGVLAPSDGQHDGTDGPDLDLTNLQPGEDLGGGSMPGLVLTQTMPDSPDMALAAGAPIPGAEDSLAHQQAMHEVNHSNG